MKKRILAFLLVIVLLVSSIGVTTLLTESDLFSGAGNSTAGDPSGTDSTPDAAPVDKDQRLTEEDPGAIRLSGADISATDPKEDDTSVSTATGSGALDENNALTIPYDLAFPEEFASEDCLYSGEQIMVKFRKGFTGKLNAAMKKAGITDLEKLMDTAAGPWYIASVSGDVQAVMANVRALKNVVVA